ncbi:MAG: glycosyltransferase family 2 protein, partial [Blastocatellia bacterium]
MSQALDRKRVFVIIPAYNEGQVIRSVLAPLIESGYGVVVVDDASADDSQSALAGLPVHYIRHAVNLGQGAALQTGMSFAIQQGARYIIHFDADGQHHPEDIPALLEPLINGDADIVFGSRFMRPEDEGSV